MNLIVIDASALIATLRNEIRADSVDDDLDGAIISAVNFGEAAQRQYRDGKTRTDMRDLANELGLVVVPVNTELALDAADIREIGRAAGLSQADCICLALAKREGVAALTGDRKWLEIADAVGVEVRLIR